MSNLGLLSLSLLGLTMGGTLMAVIKSAGTSRRWHGGNMLCSLRWWFA